MTLFQYLVNTESERIKCVSSSKYVLYTYLTYFNTVTPLFYQYIHCIIMNAMLKDLKFSVE